ncbi:MAG: HD domain-containing phosphohydrolase [Bacteriovoracaceae bacterium]
MSQILLIEKDEKVCEVYSMNLQMYLGAEVLIKNNPDEALALIKLLPSINIIITRNKIDDVDVLEKILDYLEEKGSDTPVFCLGDYATTSPKVTVFKEILDYKSVIKKGASILGVTAESMVKKKINEYVPLPINILRSMDSTKFTVYIRIKKDKNEFEYVKRFHANDSIDYAAVDRYIDSGLRNIYVPAAERLKFVNEYTNTVSAKLQDQSLAENIRLSVLSDTQTYIQQQMTQGTALEPEMVDLTNTSINAMSTSIDKEPELAQVLTDLLTAKGSYMYKHCHLLTYFSFHILNKLSWRKVDYDKKISFISFFHDLSLPNDDKLVRIHSKKELNAATNLTPEEKDLITNHAQLSANLARKFPQMPTGADSIILQHHGSFNGSGFATEFVNELSPMTICFIIAEEYAHYMIEGAINKKIDKKAIKEQLSAKYPKMLYQKIINLL